MELEVKHLAPYLPYDLNIEYNVDTMSLFTLFGIKGYTACLFRKGKSGINLHITAQLESVKPYMIPLRNLSEIMPKKGVSYTSYLWYEIISTNSDMFNKDEFYENCELGLIEFLPTIVYEQLFKWHFDVFGLIEKGLAIDINTLSVNGS